MKAKVSRGGGFRGVLDYVFDVGKKAVKNKDAERVGGNMAGQDPRELSLEFSAVRQLRPDIGRPVWHCSLSLPSGERLSTEKWGDLADDFMKRVGFDPANTPYVAVRHQDTDYDHVHIVASRVGLDGKVWLGQWEARRVIEATQALERDHGLTLTAGLGDVRAEHKKLTDREINMAIRTDKEPPRQRLQRLVDEVVKDNPTALDFAQRLEVAGVGVRANLASTGRMNGFSFEIEGIPFKGQDLGAAYKWSSLQKRGVSYEQTRDCAGLERFRTPIADRGERQGVAAGRQPAARGLKSLAGVGGERDGASLAAADQAPAGRGAGTGNLRQGDGLAAQDAGRTDAANGRERGADVRAEGREAGRDDNLSVGRPVRAEIQPGQHGADRAEDQRTAGRTDDRDHEHDGRSQESDQSGERDTPEMVVAGDGADSGRDSGRNAGGDWASRFRKASAAKRRATERDLGEHGVEQSNADRARVARKDRQTAREIDPTAYLQASGYTVKRDGRHLSVRANRDEVYRVTRKPDGHYVVCDKYGNGIGDNIALVQEIEPGTGFAEAVYRLSGAPSVIPQPRVIEPKREPPKLPAQGPTDREFGRQYLRGRGISPDTIEHAEKAGMVRYTTGGVLFVGYDRPGVAQNVTKRATAPAAPVQKRDFRGSDKQFPPVLLGDPAKVWIVEGGADALALRDIALRSGQQPPTIIVSGGANVRSFLENADVQAVLKRAEHVTVCGENEKDAETQAKADAGHQKQGHRVAEITGREVRRWTPTHQQGKDLADMNFRQVAEIERQQQTQQRSRGGPSFSR